VPEIRVSDLHKSFDGEPVLRGVNFAIPAGQCVILLGANGSGKSTMMRCLNGLTRPDRGRVLVGDSDIARARGHSLRRARQRIGMVFQQFNLVDHVSVFQNVLYGALGQHRWGLPGTLAPVAPARLRHSAMACLDRVGLAAEAARDCRELSGGQKQRVAIARTLLQAPDVVLADEPVASLDPRAGRDIMALLLDIVREHGMTVLCSLHQLELASAYGDRLLGMKAGRIELDAPHDDVDRAAMSRLYQDAAHEDTPQSPAQRPKSADAA
jgi:phosphonate transport system ATP-binding protein